MNENQTDPNVTIFAMKQKMRIGFWNVHKIHEEGKLRQVEREMLSYRIIILGLSETRWVDCGEIITNERGFAVVFRIFWKQNVT